MKSLHYVSQAPHMNICNPIMHIDLQNAAISLDESNYWRRLTTKGSIWSKTWFQPPLCITCAKHHSGINKEEQLLVARCTTGLRRASNNSSRNHVDRGKMHHWASPLAELAFTNSLAQTFHVTLVFIVIRCMMSARLPLYRRNSTGV